MIAMIVGPSATSVHCQDNFRWIDFHSEKDQDVIVWVSRALAAEKWTALRDIGVSYDAALVVTTDRSTPQASPDADTFTVWSVSLHNRALTFLFRGSNLRWLDWMQFSDGSPREIAALYDDCSNCAATTYFTAFHYDNAQHVFLSRWMRGSRAIPVWTQAAAEGVSLSQVYGILAEPNGSQFMSTWTHFDYGKQKPAEDFVYRYDRDPMSGMDRMQLLSGKDAEAMKQKLCSLQGTSGDAARGQDSPLCSQAVHARPERKPVTTPPANNQGRSVPPGARH